MKNIAFSRPRVAMLTAIVILAGCMTSPQNAQDSARVQMEQQTGLKILQVPNAANIRMDKDAVALLWAGIETDYSGMISDHDGYYPMINALMDNLADLADAIPPRSSAPRKMHLSHL